jgi:hypothetical protein
MTKTGAKASELAVSALVFRDTKAHRTAHAIIERLNIRLASFEGKLIIIK